MSKQLTTEKIEEIRKDGNHLSKKCSSQKRTLEYKLLEALKKEQSKEDVLQLILPVYSAVNESVPIWMGDTNEEDFKQYMYVFMTAFIGNPKQKNT